MTHTHEIDWLQTAKTEQVVNIGQIDPEERKILERAVRSGELKKTRAPWGTTFDPSGYAILGSGPTKTFYLPAHFEVLTSNYGK